MMRAAFNPLSPARFLPAGKRLDPLPHAAFPGRMVYFDCEICGGIHPNGFYGDCRDNENRHCEESLKRLHGPAGFEIVDMAEAD